MPISTAIHEHRFRVRYAETDASGLAHHAAYLPWLEAGRVEWLRAEGVSYADLEADGYHLAVTELRVRYVAPATFDMALALRSGLIDLRSREVTFRYELVTDERHPRQIAHARSTHLCLRDGRVVRLPESLRALVAPGA